MCLDCAATNPQAGQDQPQGETEYDDVWAHRYRSSYYTSTGYVAGSSYYDSQDTRSFDSTVGDDLGEETELGGFGES
jgi:hypothetical protein